MAVLRMQMRVWVLLVWLVVVWTMVEEAEGGWLWNYVRNKYRGSTKRVKTPVNMKVITLCMCVCVCVRARARVFERACACVRACVLACV